MAQYASGSGIPTPGSFGPAAPLLDTWSVPAAVPRAPGRDTAGQSQRLVSDFRPGDRVGTVHRHAHGLERSQGRRRLPVDARARGCVDEPDTLTRPRRCCWSSTAQPPVAATPFTLNWQPTTGVGGPIDPLAWTTAYPPSSGCALIDTGGSAIALQFTASVSSPHLRQAWVSAGRLRRRDPDPGGDESPRLAVVHGERAIRRPRRTALAGCTTSRRGRRRVATASGCMPTPAPSTRRAGTTSDPVHTGWCGDEPGPPYTDVVITVAIV